MSDVLLRPRSASELVDAAVQLYRRAPLEYVLMTAIGYAPLLVLQLVLVGFGDRLGAVPQAMPDAVTVARTAILLIASLIAWMVMSAVMVRFASEAYHDRAPELATSVRDAVPRLPAVLGAGLLKTLAIAGIPALILGVVMGAAAVLAASTGAAAGVSGAMIILGAGLVAFLGSLGGAVYFSARYFAVVQAVVLEGHGVLASMHRSSELSRGRKNHILATLGLVMIIYLMLSFALAAIGSATGSGFVRFVLQAAYTLIGYPIVGITETLLYYDARIRGEGYDIELMAESLRAAGGAASPVA